MLSTFYFLMKKARSTWVVSRRYKPCWRRPPCKIAGPIGFGGPRIAVFRLESAKWSCAAELGPKSPLRPILDPQAPFFMLLTILA